MRYQFHALYLGHVRPGGPDSDQLRMTGRVGAAQIRARQIKQARIREVQGPSAAVVKWYESRWAAENR
jgi:hypothetical protein